MPKINQQQLTEVEGTPIKVWSAPSSTEFGTKHYVLVMADKDGDVFYLCSCKGRQYNASCWHVDRAQELSEPKEPNEVAITSVWIDHEADMNDAIEQYKQDADPKSSDGTQVY